PHLLLDRLATRDSNVGGGGQGFGDYLRATQHPSGTPERRRDLAYWKEVLHHAPPLAPISGRRRSPVPTGLGLNRGTMGVLCWTLQEKLHPAAGSLRGALLAAYSQALGRQHGLD